MGTQSTWGVHSELAMETKRLIFLLFVAIAGCFAAPGVQDQLDPNNMDHMALVELRKFVEGNLMKDVNETRIFTEKSAKTSGEIATAIIKYVNKLNSESAARLTQTLKNLSTSIDANLKVIVDNAKENHKALKKQRDKMESGINTMVTDGFETLLDKVEKRLSEHQKLLSTNVAICAERRDSESALGAKSKITYDEMFQTSVTFGGKAMNRTELKEVFKPSQGDFIVPEGGAGLYEISFTAIIDTRLDSDDSLAPANFLFATQQAEGETKMIETRRLRQGPSCSTLRPTTRSTFFKSVMWRKRATASPFVSISFNPRHQLLGRAFQNSLFKKMILRLRATLSLKKNLSLLWNRSLSVTFPPRTLRW